MGASYTWEKLYMAIDALAAGQGRVGERMLSAMVSCHTLRANVEDFPDPDERARFANVVDRMTLHRSRAATSGRGLSGKELARLARDLFELFNRAVERRDAERRSRP